MNKNFTKEDIIKKHETNVKSAFTGLSLAGVLGIIYVVRYFITGNFNFHFSLSLPEMMLKLSYGGTVSTAAAYSITAAFFALYFVLTVLAVKKPKFLVAGLILYVFDFLCLLLFILILTVQFPDSFTNDVYIEVILHIFNILFLSVGVYSHRKLKNLNKE